MFLTSAARRRCGGRSRCTRPPVLGLSEPHLLPLSLRCPPCSCPTHPPQAVMGPAQPAVRWHCCC